MKRKTLYICILTLIIILCAVTYLFTKSNPKQLQIHQKCPDEYADDATGTAEYLAAMDKWTNDFYDTHPGATISDWATARYQFWVDNNCAAAIQRYEDAKTGKADPAAMERISTGIAEATNTLQYISDLGFSFNYPSDMYIMPDPEESRVLVIPNSYKTNGNEPVTAVVISATLNDPPITPLEWLESPDSGADMSKGYNKLTIDGQEAISMGGGTWIVVNTPDNKRQLSIATLPFVDPSQSLVDEMGIIANSLVFTK